MMNFNKLSTEALKLYNKEIEDLIKKREFKDYKPKADKIINICKEKFDFAIKKLFEEYNDPNSKLTKIRIKIDLEESDNLDHLNLEENDYYEYHHGKVVIDL